MRYRIGERKHSGVVGKPAALDARALDGPVEPHVENRPRPNLRPTHMPAVLISQGRIDEPLAKIAGFAPLDERRKASKLLIAGRTIADATAAYPVARAAGRAP